MARKVSAGIAGGAAVAGLQAFTTTLTSANNLDIVVEPAGTGRFLINGNAQLLAQGDLRFADADSSNWVAFQSPATVAANVTWTLPSVDGAAGQFLSTNASGTLSWASGSLSLSDQTTSATVHYPLITTATSGTVTASNTSSTKFTFQPSTGTLTVTNFVESSSVTLKENFTPIEDALSKLVQLSGWIYDRKDGSLKGEAGLIADDVIKIIPNVVTKDEYGNPSGVNYTRLSAYLIEAVKTLNQKIEDLTGKK
jgi:hypothetical protein